MAVYLFNLGFTLANAANGNFLDYLGSQTGLGQSNTWFEYNGSGLPSGVVDNVVPLSALNVSDWDKMTTSPPFCAGADYMLVRIFNTDTFPAPPPTLLLRLTAVLGRGTSATLPASTPLQAPFVMGAKARPVIDTDNASNPPNWPAPTGTDGAWTYCLGMLHGVINEYSCNVGATAYVSSGTYAGFSGFGHDPQLHVVSTLEVTSCEDEDESAA